MIWALLIIGAILIIISGFKGFWCILGIILMILGFAMDASQDKPRRSYTRDGSYQ